MVKYIPSRGDIVWVNFNPNQGNEICKTRPAVVISPQKYNAKTNLAIFLPITSKVKGYLYRPAIIKHNSSNQGNFCPELVTL